MIRKLVSQFRLRALYEELRAPVPRHITVGGALALALALHVLLDALGRLEDAIARAPVWGFAIAAIVFVGLDAGCVYAAGRLARRAT